MMNGLLDIETFIRYFTDETSEIPLKSKWGKGPWQHEPEIVLWIDEITGYCCLARRNRAGVWNGYIALDDTHPYYGMDLDKLVKKLVFSVPSHFCMKYWQKDKSLTLYQPVSYAEYEGTLYFIGFDNCSLPSFSPAFGVEYEENNYVPLEFVKKQCESLARRLKKAEKKVKKNEQKNDNI